MTDERALVQELQGLHTCEGIQYIINHHLIRIIRSISLKEFKERVI